MNRCGTGLAKSGGPWPRPGWLVNPCGRPREAVRGARRRRRLRQQDRPESEAAPRRPQRRAPVELLGGVDHMHAGKGQRQAGAEPLPGGGRAHQQLALQRRDIKRLGPVLGRELRRAHQGRELRAAEGAALAEGRAVHPGPEPAPVRHDEDHPAAGAEHPRHLLEQVVGTFGLLQRMHQHGPVDRGRRQRQQRRLDQRRGRKPVSEGQFTTPCAAGMKAMTRSASGPRTER